MTGPQWTSFVAIGDSFTEGMDDPRGDGTYRGWADRVAEALAAHTPGFRYANLAVRGRLFTPIVTDQVPAALAMVTGDPPPASGGDLVLEASRPADGTGVPVPASGGRSAPAGAGSLVSFVGGGNDVLRRGFDLAGIGQRLDRVIGRLTDAGATVLMLTGADVTFLLPAKRVVRERGEAYNEVIRRTAARHGAILVDLWPDPGFGDRRMWSTDRLHLSPAGHRRAAALVLAGLGMPVDAGWTAGLPPAPRPSWWAARGEDLRWAGRYLAPWVKRRLTGRSSGDGIRPKRPTLLPVEPPADRRA